jgi:hypothetical protein
MGARLGSLALELFLAIGQCCLLISSFERPPDGSYADALCTHAKIFWRFPFLKVRVRVK